MSGVTGFRGRVCAQAYRRPGGAPPLERVLLVGCASLLIVAGVTVGPGLTVGPAGAVTADQGTSTGFTSTASTDLCGAVAPGQARCLAMRRTDVTQPAALTSNPSVVAPASTPAGYGPAGPVS